MNQNLSNFNQRESSHEQQEISLIDILSFFNGHYKTIVIFTIAGVALSALYLVATPKRYEATAQIAMAQITSNLGLQPQGINIEDPALLVTRFSLPTSFTPEVVNSCGVDSGTNRTVAPIKFIKLTVPKGVNNVVELNVFGASWQEANSCANAIFELIKTTQAEIAAPYIAAAQTKLDDDIERLSKAKELIAKADKLGSAMGATYLSTRDEIRFLLDEITVLKNIVASSKNGATRLISPIHASDIPVAPKERVALAAGLFGGLSFALLLVWFRRMRVKLKSYAK